MSADARVARAIQDVRRIYDDRPFIPDDIASWFAEFRDAVDDLICETRDAVYLTDNDINQY